MKALLLICFSLAATLCLGQQTINGSITHDALQRTYILYVPATYSPGSPAPLVINFHGYTSNASQQMFYGDFRMIADTAGFLLVHPMGTLDFQGNTYWNANWGGTVDDIGFTGALIDSLAAEYNIDLNRVYSTGMSNGGFMSYTLACELSNRIAAIASVTGTMNLNQPQTCNPLHPMPVMEIHGTADGTVPYTGGGFIESIDNTLAYWASFNQCDTPAIVTNVPDIDTLDGCTAEHHVYQNGINGVEVEHYKIIDGEHTWPGAPVIIGTTNYDIDASYKIWEFFAKYDINGVILSNSPPLSNFSANFTTIVEGNSIDFTDLSTNGPTSWSWSFNGASPAISTDQNPTNITYSVPGCYEVELMVTNSFGSDTVSKICYIDVTASTGYSVNSFEVSIEGYPNPTNGLFTFKIKVIETQDLQVKIINTLGQEIFSTKLKQVSPTVSGQAGIYQKQMDLSNHPKGIYFIKVQGDNVMEVEKVVIY